MKKMSTFGLFTALHILLLTANISEANIGEFPGRKLFPEIPYLELSNLRKIYKNTVIVDVRSKYEYDTLRIKGAKNIPLASKTFIDDMKQLRKQTDRPIVVYCNGRTCMKSYEAVRICTVNHISDVSAFDAGIMDWSKNQPKLALLLNEPLNDAKNLISKEEFKKHVISPDEFGNRIADSEDIVLDVRDRFQREGLSIFVGREYRLNLDDTKRMDRFIKQAKDGKKALLIYDAAGKQVRWLQYYLEKKGVKEYRFMDGGIHAYYKGLKSGSKK